MTTKDDKSTDMRKKKNRERKEDKHLLSALCHCKISVCTLCMHVQDVAPILTSVWFWSV